jgi:hypothetical protein
MPRWPQVRTGPGARRSCSVWLRSARRSNDVDMRVWGRRCIPRRCRLRVGCLSARLLCGRWPAALRFVRQFVYRPDGGQHSVLPHRAVSRSALVCCGGLCGRSMCPPAGGELATPTAPYAPQPSSPYPPSSSKQSAQKRLQLTNPSRQNLKQLRYFDVLAFDAESARAFGAVAAALRASGRKPVARAYDALIAASAIAYGWRYTAATREISPRSHNCSCEQSHTPITFSNHKPAVHARIVSLSQRWPSAIVIVTKYST